MNNSWKKTRLAAGLLFFFLGGIGVHRYYLGHRKSGLTMTILTALGFVGVLIGTNASSRDEVAMALAGIFAIAACIASVRAMIDQLFRLYKKGAISAAQYTAMLTELRSRM